jgi:hypothetical protein
MTGENMKIRVFTAAIFFGLFSICAAFAQTFTQSTIGSDAAIIYRDYNTAGVPSSGVFNPRKSDIRSWGAAISSAVNLPRITAAFDSSAGSTPHNIFDLNINSFPAGNQIPLNTMQGIVSKIKVDTSSTLAPWPHTAISAYMLNGPNVSGGSSVGVFSALSQNTNLLNVSQYAYNGVVRNLNGLDAAIDGNGYDFDTLLGMELDVDVVKKSGSVTPVGTVIGLKIIGGSTVKPTHGASGIRIFPMGTGLPWDTAYVVEDAAATTGMFIGAASAAAANVASMPLYWRGYDGSSASTLAHIQVGSDGSFQIFPPSGKPIIMEGEIYLNNTVNNVSPTSPNRTITMVIGGTPYYIHAKTTNN